MLTTEYSNKIAAIHKARVNVKSLAAEAKLNRQEELRASPIYRTEIAAHRRGRLREEARYAHLALGFIRGRAYRTIEKSSKPACAVRLYEKVRRFLYQRDNAAIKKWLSE